VSLLSLFASFEKNRLFGIIIIMRKETKENLMRLCIKEADKATTKGNSPFGAILSDDQGKVIAKSHNTSRSEKDPIAHAEIKLIKEVSKKLKTKDLNKYILISNAQSCSMCFSAAIQANIKHFIFGADSEGHMNPDVTVFDLQKRCKYKTNIETGILKDECEINIKDNRKKLKN